MTSLREYDIAIRLHPQDPDLHYWSGVVLETAVERGQQVRIGLKTVEPTYDMAIERFENCLSVDETYTEAHVRLGHRYRAKEEHNTAADHFKRAVELEPDRVGLYEMLGRYLWDLDRREEAREIYKQYHARDPKHIDTLYAIGRISYELQEYEQAIEWLEQLRRLVPDHPMANADLAVSYYETDDLRRALQHADVALEQLAEDEAQQLRLHRVKGLILAAMDDQSMAAVELYGRTDEAQDIRLPLTLGWALTVYERPQGSMAEIEVKPETVIALANQALALDAESTDALELLGWGKYLAQDYAGAKAEFLKLKTDDPRIAYRLGMTLFQMGPEHYPQAKELLEVAEDFRQRGELFDQVRYDVRDAQRAIRDHERQVERQRREAEKQRKAAEAQRAREEARRKREAGNQ